jgi:signal transduction histidine kinase
LLAVYTCSSIALAFFTTNRAREIFSRVGRAVLRAEGARGGVFALLQDHHDFRSTLGSLQLRADRLGETLEQTSSSSPDTAQLRLQLQQSIDLLSDATQKTRDRALGALSGLTSPSAASVDQALATARKDPGLVGLRVDVQLGPTEVLFGGGTEGLARLLGHFLVNAVEGNGRCGAEGVSIRTAKTAPALIDLILEDDGPGFSEEMLKLAGRSRATSTKDGSAGIGLWLSRSTVLAAGGSMRLTNTPGGARVSLRLPSAKAADLDTDDS